MSFLCHSNLSLSQAPPVVFEWKHNCVICLLSLNIKRQPWYEARLILTGQAGSIDCLNAVLACCVDTVLDMFSFLSSFFYILVFLIYRHFPHVTPPPICSKLGSLFLSASVCKPSQRVKNFISPPFHSCLFFFPFL